MVRSLGANNAVSTECNRIIHADCFGSRTPFRSARVRLAHQPRGAFALGRLEHPALGGPLHTCGPTLREEVTGLGVAAGAVSARRLFDRRVPRVVVRGSYTHADPLGAPAFDDGVLHTRVTWTLVLRRRAP